MMSSDSGSQPGPIPTGLFGAGPSRQRASAGLSPYLNVDPTYLQTQAPEYIMNQDTKRGMMEKSFTAIGSSVIVGGMAGGAYGFFDGVRQTAMLEGKLRRTQITNYTIKSGGSISNALGSVAVIYSALYALASLQFEEDNETKSIACGTITGAMYKSSAGIKKMATGGAFGLGLASIWALVIKKNNTVNNYV